jgi:hypothetical protein
MKRLVETDRWRDAWFIQLHPNAKLLLSYLYDNCDESGCIDVNWPLFATQLNMQKDFIKTSLKALQPALLSDKKKKLFIIDFLKHQKKLPLIKGTEEADWIIAKLQANLPKFNNAPEIVELLNKVEDPNKNLKSKSESNKFVPPTFDVFKSYYLKQSSTADDAQIQSLYDHYLSCGWKVANKPMKDWEAAIRVAINRKKSSSSSYNNNGASSSNENKKTRTEATLNAVDKFKPINVPEDAKQ